MKLCVTYCSREKHEGILSPDKLYNSPRIGQFTGYCKRKNLNWAILSAKYGLFFPDEKRGKYDVTLKSDEKCWLGIRLLVDKKKLPKEESDISLKELTETVKAQVNKRLVEQVTFYTWSIKQPKCYLTMLHYVLDSCDKPHSWSELLECIKSHGKIKVVTQLDFNS